MQWGSATDGETIYTASSNGNNASRDRNLPFYPTPLNPIYPGFPGFLNAETEFSGPGFGLGLAGEPWTLVNPPGEAVANADGVSTWVDASQLKTITGFWSALDAATGEILWQRPLPTDGRPPVDETPEPDPSGGAIHGSVTLANGVLFGGGSMPSSCPTRRSGDYSFAGAGISVGLMRARSARETCSVRSTVDRSVASSV
jgi:hypothetical protein